MDWGGGSQGVWLCQVGDLRKLPVLTWRLERPGRHRVMLWCAQCFQCGCIARCISYQLFVLAGLEWASSQVRLGRLGAQELQCACTVRSIQSQLFCICRSYFMYRDCFIKDMSNHHAAFRSDSLSTNEKRRYSLVQCCVLLPSQNSTN